MAKKKKDGFKEVDINGVVNDIKTKGEAKLSDHVVEPEKKAKAEVKAEAKPEKKAPQMVTVNGDEVTHAHIFKSNNSEDWFFTARLNGEPLKPRIMTPDEAKQYFENRPAVEELMQRYYPTKLEKKLSAEEFKNANVLSDGRTIDKFNVYKEKNEESADYGKYRFYAQVGDLKMSGTASKEDLNAYFDRTMTPEKLVEKNFGPRLGLASHYEQFQLPKGVTEDNIRIVKNKETKAYEIQGNFGKAGKTVAKELLYYDRENFFATHAASKAQLGAKYLSNELKAFIAEHPVKKQIQQPKLNM